jgi:excisionase family DNA binding protein
MNTDLLDVEESAAFLHVKSATVRSWILKKKIGYVKLGRRVFLRKQDLLEMIERSFVRAGEATQNAN